MKPYTYLIKHKPTGRVYYGVRSANKAPARDDLWRRYFTSSPAVKTLIESTGADSFEVQVRKEFNTQEEAVAWETKVLRRCKVLASDKWINQNVAGYIVPTEESRRKISEYHKDKPKSAEHARRLSESQKGSKRPWSASNLPKDVSGENNGMYNKHHTDKAKRKIGEKNKAAQLAKGDDHHMKKIDWTPAMRKAMGDKARGTKWTKEAVERRSAKIRGQKREKKYCPHCDRMIAVGWYNRHGDNCKSFTEFKKGS